MQDMDICKINKNDAYAYMDMGYLNDAFIELRVIGYNKRIGRN